MFCRSFYHIIWIKFKSVKCWRLHFAKTKYLHMNIISQRYYKCGPPCFQTWNACLVLLTPSTQDCQMSLSRWGEESRQTKKDVKDKREKSYHDGGVFQARLTFRTSWENTSKSTLCSYIDLATSTTWAMFRQLWVDQNLRYFFHIEPGPFSPPPLSSIKFLLLPIVVNGGWAVITGQTDKCS